MSTVCAVLAAGASTRLGTPKQLLPWSERENFIQHAVEHSCRSNCSRVAVVIGAHGHAVRRTLYGRRVDFVTSQWEHGLAASVHAATAWAIELRAQALLLTVCDQPLLTTEHLGALLERSEQGTRLVASFYADQGGVPAVFPSRYFPALLGLSGDQGAAPLLRANPTLRAVPWSDGEFDIDTPSDLVRFAARTWPARREWVLEALKRALPTPALKPAGKAVSNGTSVAQASTAYGAPWPPPLAPFNTTRKTHA